MTRQLPQAFAMRWHRDGTVGFSGFGTKRVFVAQGEETDRVRALLSELHGESEQSNGVPVPRPPLGDKVRMRWAKKAQALRFYFEHQPSFETACDHRADELRSLQAKLYAEALPQKELTAMLRERENGDVETMAGDFLRGLCGGDDD